MVDAPQIDDGLEGAIVAGAVKALRARAAKLRQKAADGRSSAGEHFPAVVIQTPEAAAALNLAAGFDQIAVDIERGAL